MTSIIISFEDSFKALVSEGVPHFTYTLAGEGNSLHKQLPMPGGSNNTMYCISTTLIAHLTSQVR